MFPELQDEVDENKEDLAEAHYLRTLCRKMFDRLTWARQHMNMPRRKDFLWPACQFDFALVFKSSPQQVWSMKGITESCRVINW